MSFCGFSETLGVIVWIVPQTAAGWSKGGVLDVTSDRVYELYTWQVLCRRILEFALISDGAYHSVHWLNSAWQVFLKYFERTNSLWALKHIYIMLAVSETLSATQRNGRPCMLLDDRNWLRLTPVDFVLSTTLRQVRWLLTLKTATTRIHQSSSLIQTSLTQIPQQQHNGFIIIVAGCESWLWQLSSTDCR